MVSELDYMAAIRAWLVTVTGVARVYVNGLPKGTIDRKNPAQAVAVNQSGGLSRYGERDNLPLVQQRVDIVCYGETEKDAYDLLRNVASAMKALARYVQSVSGTDIMLHSAVKSGGANHLIDEDIDLPISVQSFVVTAEA